LKIETKKRAITHYAARTFIQKFSKLQANDLDQFQRLRWKTIIYSYRNYWSGMPAMTIVPKEAK
jgi:hypothetical protein